MTAETKTVFIDTAPFIYFIENNPKYADKAEHYLTECLYLDKRIISSVITYMEFCVVPEREEKRKVIKDFNELLLKLSITLKEIDLSIAEKAAKLRAKYQFLKGLDALQLALAIDNHCDEFFTNDKNLLAIKEIKIILLDK